MNLKININLDNEAFEDQEGEISRILRQLAEKISYDGRIDGGKIMDVNGNSVGTWEITE
jgi:hypothetical protein